MPDVFNPAVSAPPGWIIDRDGCQARHTSGLVVQFCQSDLLPGAVVGEVLEPGSASNVAELLQEAGMLYAQVRLAQH